MKELITYLAQTAALAACSWLVYKAVFSRDSLHRVRRFVLLLMIACSFALPVCRITITREMPALIPEAKTYNSPHVQEQGYSSFLKEESAARNISAGEKPSLFRENGLWLGAGIVYLAGMAAMLAWRAAGAARVRRIMRRAVERYDHEGIEVLVVADDIRPFSFEGRIVMSESDDGPDREMILRHEATHIRERHGADLAAVNLAAAVLWFNPFVWLLRRELILVHEIAADGGVIQSGVDVKQYQFLLISKIACTGGLLPVANHFRTSELRKRIVSMKKKTSRTAALKLLLLVPLVAAALAVFARTHYVAADSETAQPTETAPEKEQLYLPFGNSFRLAAEYVERVVPTTGRTRLMHGVLELNESDRRTKTRLHNGIDIVPENDTLRSPYSGVVNSAVSGQGYGNKLVISHAEALQTVYLHLAGFLVSEGETVKGGQPIAIVGNTGASVAKHLHFETLVNGKHVDPMKTLFGIETGASGTAIDKGGMISLNIPGAK